MKIKFCKETRQSLLDLNESKKVSIEGNILKLIDTEGDPVLDEYVKYSIKRQKELQKKRLEITKKVQNQKQMIV